MVKCKYCNEEFKTQNAAEIHAKIYHVPKCFSTLKPETTCIGCVFAQECVETHEQDYLKRRAVDA